MKTEIYAVFESTLENMNVLATMFRMLNKKTSMWSLKGFIPEPKDEDEELDNEELLDYTNFLDLLAVMVCNPLTMKRKQWPDYDKCLDYMEDMVERIA